MVTVMGSIVVILMVMVTMACMDWVSKPDTREQEVTQEGFLLNILLYLNLKISTPTLACVTHLRN